MAETDNSTNGLPALHWYYATRGLGTLLILFGLLVDHTEARSTIILTGAGLLGVDKVARSESSSKK
jgi:hypothetical protein